jgi:hypothetical protein
MPTAGIGFGGFFFLPLLDSWTGGREGGGRRKPRPPGRHRPTVPSGSRDHSGEDTSRVSVTRPNSYASVHLKRL